jgi:predicted GIY-YIG superfamily endonuclease
VKTNTLYRFYDSTGRLLYVGITSNPVARFRQHRQDKVWWSDVADIKMQHFGSRTDLEMAEKIAIRDERPLWNVMHARKVDSQSVDKAKKSHSSEPVWACSNCHCGKGAWLFMSREQDIAAETCRSWWKQYEYEMHTVSSWKPVDLGRVMSAPDEGKWTVLCSRCARDTGDYEPLDNVAYAIELTRADTWQKLMDWTIHLMEKDWFRYTNWADVMRKAGAKE